MSGNKPASGAAASGTAAPTGLGAHLEHFEAAYQLAVFNHITETTRSARDQPVTRKLRAKGVQRVGTLKKVNDDRVDFLPDKEAVAADKKPLHSFGDVLKANIAARNFHVAGMNLNWLLLRVDDRLPAAAQLYAKIALPWRARQTGNDLAELTKIYNMARPVALPTPPNSSARSFKLIDVPVDGRGTEVVLEVRLFKGSTRWFRKVADALLFASPSPAAVIPPAKRKDYIKLVEDQRKRDAKREAEQLALSHSQEDAAGVEALAMIEQRKAELKQAVNKVRGTKPETLLALKSAFEPDVRVSAVFVGRPSAGKSTLLKRLLTDSGSDAAPGTGDSPITEGVGEGNNTKLPIRYEYGTANSVSLKFCSRDELRKRTSGAAPDRYGDYENQELVVHRDWLKSDDAKAALKKRGAADVLELKDVSAVVRGIAAPSDNQYAAILDGADGRALFQAIDFVVVKCTTCSENAACWDTPGVPAIALGAEPAAGDKLALRQLNDVVNEHIFLWRDATGKLVAQRKRVCDVVVHVLNDDGVRQYDSTRTNELFAACGLFDAVARGLAENPPVSPRSITTYHQLYSQVYGAPQLVVVYPKVSEGEKSKPKPLADLTMFLDSNTEEQSTAMLHTLATTIATLPPSGGEQAAVAMSLLGRHYAEFKEVLCLPNNSIVATGDRVRVTQRRCAEVLASAAEHWRNVALFRAAVDLCHEQARAQQGRTSQDEATDDVMPLNDDLQALLMSVNLDESVDDQDFDALRDSYVNMAKDNAREVATKLADGTGVSVTLMKMFDSNIDAWVDASVAALKVQLSGKRDEDHFVDTMDNFLDKEPVKWINHFRAAAQQHQRLQQHGAVHKACESLISSLEQQIGCLQATAADVFAPLARKVGDALESVKGDEEVPVAPLMRMPTASTMALDGGGGDDDDNDAVARTGKRKLSGGGRDKKARTEPASAAAAAVAEPASDAASDVGINDNDALELSFALATVSQAGTGFGVEFAPSLESFKTLGDAALTVFLVPQQNDKVFKNPEKAATLVRSVSAMLAGIDAELVVVCETADEKNYLEASVTDKLIDSSVWAVQLPPKLKMAAKFDALLALSRSLKLKRVVFAPWRDRQGVKEFRLGTFRALPPNESLARALRRMTDVLESEQKGQRDDVSEILQHVATLLHVDLPVAAQGDQARFVLEEAGDEPTFGVPARNVNAREAVERLKSLLPDAVEVTEKNGTINGATIKVDDVKTALLAPVRAAAVALLDETVTPVAGADNLSSHSSFSAACTDKKLGVLLIDVEVLGARGSFAAGDRWTTWFPHRHIFKVADFALSQKAVLGAPRSRRKSQPKAAARS